MVVEVRHELLPIGEIGGATRKGVFGVGNRPVCTTAWEEDWGYPEDGAALPLRGAGGQRHCSCEKDRYRMAKTLGLVSAAHRAWPQSGFAQIFFDETRGR